MCRSFPIAPFCRIRARSNGRAGVKVARDGNFCVFLSVRVSDLDKDGTMTDTATTTATAEDQLAVFRQRRDLAVVQPKGNLALVNTQWVDSEQSIYGVPGVWAPLPAGQSGLKVTASAAEGIRVDGELVDGSAIVAGKDSAQPGDITFSDTVSGFVIASEDGNYALRVWDANSEAIQNFGTIDAFEYNPEWVITATFTEIAGGTTVGFEHMKDEGKTRDFDRAGRDHLHQRRGRLPTWPRSSPGGRCRLVFGDATNGDSTYSVGRFLYVAPNAGWHHHPRLQPCGAAALRLLLRVQLPDAPEAEPLRGGDRSRREERAGQGRHPPPLGPARGTRVLGFSQLAAYCWINL